MFSRNPLTMNNARCSVPNMSVSFECFLHEISSVAGWIVTQFSKATVAETFVEPARLELEGVKPGAVTPALQRLVLRPLHQLGPEPASAQRVRHDQQLDEQPVEDRASPQSAHHTAFSVVDGDDERPIIVSAGLRLVVGDERARNCRAQALVHDVGRAENEGHISQSLSTIRTNFPSLKRYVPPAFS